MNIDQVEYNQPVSGECHNETISGEPFKYEQDDIIVIKIGKFIYCYTPNDIKHVLTYNRPTQAGDYFEEVPNLPMVEQTDIHFDPAEDVVERAEKLMPRQEKTYNWYYKLFSSSLVVDESLRLGYASRISNFEAKEMGSKTFIKSIPGVISGMHDEIQKYYTLVPVSRDYICKSLGLECLTNSAAQNRPIIKAHFDEMKLDYNSANTFTGEQIDMDYKYADILNDRIVVYNVDKNPTLVVSDCPNLKTVEIKSSEPFTSMKYFDCESLETVPMVENSTVVFSGCNNISSNLFRKDIKLDRLVVNNPTVSNNFFDNLAVNQLTLLSCQTDVLNLTNASIAEFHGEEVRIRKIETSNSLQSITLRSVAELTDITLKNANGLFIDCKDLEKIQIEFKVEILQIENCGNDSLEVDTPMKLEISNLKLSSLSFVPKLPCEQAILKDIETERLNASGLLFKESSVCFFKHIKAEKFILPVNASTIAIEMSEISDIISVEYKDCFSISISSVNCYTCDLGNIILRNGGKCEIINTNVTQSIILPRNCKNVKLKNVNPSVSLYYSSTDSDIKISSNTSIRDTLKMSTTREGNTITFENYPHERLVISDVESVKVDNAWYLQSIELPNTVRSLSLFACPMLTEYSGLQNLHTVDIEGAGSHFDMNLLSREMRSISLISLSDVDGINTPIKADILKLVNIETDEKELDLSMHIIHRLYLIDMEDLFYVKLPKNIVGLQLENNPDLEVIYDDPPPSLKELSIVNCPKLNLSQAWRNIPRLE